MKHFLTLLLFVSCAFFAFGQDLDLIVTTTGDSLTCKIVEVGTDDIQFRFGEGNIISIKRSEVASYRYNYEATAPSGRSQPARTSQPKRTRERKKSPVDEYPPFYVSLTAGFTSFGKISLGDTDGSSFALVADAAYFFNHLGAGIKFGASSCDVDFNYDISHHDRLMFYGPALYGRWGKNSITFNACAAVGGLHWKFSKEKSPPAEALDFVYKVDENISQTSFGCILSAGVGYRFTKNMGVGLNIQSLFGELEYDGTRKITRNPSGIGCTFGINYNF